MSILIAYYTWSGNTKRIAELIKAETGGTLFEILPKNAYTKSYSETVEQAKKEIRAGYRPELKADAEGIGGYDTVFVGSPNWWSTAAPPVASFLERHSLAGKTVIPFCTHGGGGEAQVLSGIRGMCPGAKALEGLSLYNDGGPDAEVRVREWLDNIGIR